MTTLGPQNHEKPTKNEGNVGSHGSFVFFPNP